MSLWTIRAKSPDYLALCSLGEILLLNQVFVEAGQIVWRERPMRGEIFFFLVVGNSSLYVGICLS